MHGKRIIIFTGPSLSHREASDILRADYRPPVRRGDIIDALSEKPEIIGIIDGVFHQSPAVGHREIVEALRMGVTVVGGASMGALRASELHDLGMVGVGRIFRAYLNGDLESDDDVAVAFNPETLEAFSDSLVSIHFNFKRALRRGIIGEDDFKELMKIAKDLFYPLRNYKRILHDAEIPENRRASLMSFLESEGRDIKREDALEVIKYIKRLVSSDDEDHGCETHGS
ncbi:TfuA-related McrA-glycine thioamidation protein [Methanothermobacter sp.]|uniref:TfuA-related McrA-glycine thioamidation protein n=1 Tax=Methanothermobacter sp. TaxID=1884223 RepID=UPI002608969B|nr:TfuA-related McrA-glycine thioamidation protein [Methanothermobacter sp.]MDI9619087.1 TfuA-related McrA-glycine thioamidation protein [Methanothermobacter sp.]